MTDARRGGLAFIVGNVALIITMALHPTGEQMATAGERFDAIALLNTLVHTLGIFSIPILFLGAIALTREIADPKRIAFSASVIYALALFAGLCAAAMSGFITTEVLRRIARTTDPQTQQLWRVLFHYTGMLNQAFARILVVGGAIAILLWSCVIRGVLRWYGIVSSAIIILAVATSVLPLNVHGYGLVVLLQAGWFVAIGLKMWRGIVAS